MTSRIFHIHVVNTPQARQTEHHLKPHDNVFEEAIACFLKEIDADVLDCQKTPPTQKRQFPKQVSRERESSFEAFCSSHSHSGHKDSKTWKHHSLAAVLHKAIAAVWTGGHVFTQNSSCFQSEGITPLPAKFIVALNAPRPNSLLRILKGYDPTFHLPKACTRC